MSILEAMAKTLAVVAVLGVVIAMSVAYAYSATTEVTCNAAGRQISFNVPPKGKCINILHLRLCYPR